MANFLKGEANTKTRKGINYEHVWNRKNKK